MGDDIGSGSVTGCHLRLLGDHRRQTELHYVGWARKKKQNRLITQLISQHLGRLDNPYQIKWKEGVDYAYQISMSHPIFLTFLHPCSQMNGYLLTSFDFDSLGSSD